MKSRSKKSCTVQHLPTDEPEENRNEAELGKLAEQLHAAIVACEKDASPRYWQLGRVLSLARSKVRHGNWRQYLKSHQIHPSRASRAVAIFKTFAKEDQVTNMTVIEAYAARTRKSPTGHSRKDAPSKTHQRSLTTEEVDLPPAQSVERILENVAANMSLWQEQARQFTSQEARLWLDKLSPILAEFRLLEETLIQREALNDRLE